MSQSPHHAKLAKLHVKAKCMPALEKKTVEIVDLVVNAFHFAVTLQKTAELTNLTTSYVINTIACEGKVKKISSVFKNTP